MAPYHVNVHMLGGRPVFEQQAHDTAMRLLARGGLHALHDDHAALRGSQAQFQEGRVLR
jgi:hypothetical protein